MSEQDSNSGDNQVAPEAAGSGAFLRRSEPVLPEKIGPYRIVRKLGAGGMGAVFEGLHEAIERRVAIKVLHSRYSHDPDTAKRFINEARAVNRIDHPGVVQVSDTGQLPDGGAYIVMELLQGEALSKRIHRNAPLPAGEVIDLTIQIAAALAAAHERGIIHRDLKPDNIMVVPDRQMPTGERTKVLDFGIAKLAQEQEKGSLRTHTNSMLGTPYYMSPEQAQGSAKVDHKTDVYALGIIVFEMLTGKPPFSGEGLGELIVKHMSTPPPPLAEHAPDSPPELNQLVARLLEKDRTKRPTMVELGELLESMSERYPRPRLRLSQGLPLVRMPTTEEPARPSTLSRAAGPRAVRKRRQQLVIAVLGSMLTMSLVVFWVLRSRHPELPQVVQPTPVSLTIPASPKPIPNPAQISPTTPKAESVSDAVKPESTRNTPPAGDATAPVGGSTSKKRPPAVLANGGTAPRMKKTGLASTKKVRSTKVKDVRSAIEE